MGGQEFHAGSSPIDWAESSVRMRNEKKHHLGSVILSGVKRRMEDNRKTER